MNEIKVHSNYSSPGKKNDRRLLIKLSGEALGGEGAALDFEKVDGIAEELALLQKKGYQISVMIGGGNIYRGRDSAQQNRTDADHMGMLATTINSLAMQNSLRNLGAEVQVLSAISMEQVCDTFTERHASALLDDGVIVLFAAGIGRPFFSTDTAAALRALEVGAAALYCAKNVDGIYEADPRKVEGLKPYLQISYDEFIQKGLQAMDQTAVALCRDYDLPIFVFKLESGASISTALTGEAKGSWIHS